MRICSQFGNQLKSTNFSEYSHQIPKNLCCRSKYSFDLWNFRMKTQKLDNKNIEFEKKHTGQTFFNFFCIYSQSRFLTNENPVKLYCLCLIKR